MFIFEQNMTLTGLFSLPFLGSGGSPVTLDMLSVTCLSSCAQEHSKITSLRPVWLQNKIILKNKNISIKYCIFTLYPFYNYYLS